MKIAIVIDRIEPWRGGAETSTLELARLLADRGHDVHIITSSRSASPPDLTIHTLTAPTVLRPLRTAAFIRKATAFVRDQGFDVVHAITTMPAADCCQPRGGLLPEVMARNVATRPTASRRLLKRALGAMNVKQRGLLDLERAALAEGGPTILAVSNYVARQCREHYGLGPPRVRVVFNGVSVMSLTETQRADARASIRRQYGVDDATLLLLFVAHNFRLKGLGPLIETVGRLVGEGFVGFKLLVVGRDNPAGYQRRLRSQGWERFVQFAGPTQRGTSFYAAADVCVHPTYYDPCSRVVLEALVHGVPCVTTAYNGAAEVMTDGREGFVLGTPEEIDTWAERIRRLADVRLRRAMSEAALTLRGRLDMRRHVAELDAVFAEIVQRKAGCASFSAGTSGEGPTALVDREAG